MKRGRFSPNGSFATVGTTPRRHPSAPTLNRGTTEWVGAWTQDLLNSMVSLTTQGVPPYAGKVGRFAHGRTESTRIEA